MHTEQRRRGAIGPEGNHLGFADRHRLRQGGYGLVHGPGQSSEGGRGNQGRHGETGTELRAKPGEEPQGRQRVAAEGKKGIQTSHARNAQ